MVHVLVDSGVAAAKSAAGDNYVNVLGANTAAQCLDTGVLDEILVFTAPVLLGDGVRLFDHPGGTDIKVRTPQPDPRAAGDEPLATRRRVSLRARGTGRTSESGEVALAYRLGT